MFLLCLELWALEADWTVWLTASAVVAYASTAVIGRPTLDDILEGKVSKGEDKDVEEGEAKEGKVT